MKILLLGKGGQVGWELQRALAPLGEVIGVDHDSGRVPGGLHGDFSQPEKLAETVAAVKPHLIVNAAAHTAVDKAESEIDLCRAINATAPGVLAKCAAETGAWLLHYSTDYVFDGGGIEARTEDAPTGPLSVYGQTKLEGEDLIRASGCKHLILRTSWVYGARGGNFAKTMLKLAGERERLTVIDDQIGAPTGADLLADLSAHMLRTAVQRGDMGLSGTYHAVAGGETSWHGYATFVVEKARALGVDLKVQTVDRVPTSNFPTPAQRPLNSRLKTDKLQQAFDLRLPHWQQGVERMLVEFLGR